MNDDSIIIRPSDKGSQVVVLNTIDYEKMMKDTLNNDKTYEETNLTLQDIEKRVMKILNKLNNDGDISNQMAKNMKVKDAKIAKI